MNLDSIDVKILEVLQQNARVSVSELSKRVNLSLSAVSERLKKLENSGIIEQYTTILDPVAMNKQASAIMMVSLDDPSSSEDFLQFVMSNPEVLDCYYLASEYDYCIKIVTGTNAELEAILNKIKSVSTIKRTVTNVVLRTVKQQYSIAPVANR
ncbi:MAG: Lrp/AsnC family transcriptional regulator [Firmicutes bacterium]|nr:Lrp/AsnC family transcriptional regulator [Bacillota bacterium]